MSFPLFLAKRYVKSKKDSNFISLISVISIVGIALGVAVLILALTILNGFEKTVEEKITNFNSHIHISAFGRQNLPDYKFAIPMLKKEIDKDLKSISPFVSKSAIIKSKHSADGVEIRGILPEMDNSNIGKYIIEGNYNLSDSIQNNKIVIGKKLANKLDLKIGNKVTLFTIRNNEVPSFVNPPGVEQFIVTGIYESGFAAYDDLTAYINLNKAQNIFNINNNVSGYNIQLNSIAKLDSLSDYLNKSLPYPYYSRTLFELHQHIFTWLDLQKKPIPIVLGLITLVAVFNIVGTLLMIVIEKTGTIGILKSLGTSRKQIIGIFTYQGIYLALIGIVSGNLFALVLSILQKNYNLISLPSSVYFISSVPISIDIENYLIVSITAFILSVLASIIPSYIASKFNPITSIKFN
ncbi:MAG: ABC transporter permease [Melioribacteraceae bacterium]|nr:ABC transporter permease [Melioribacteraceae bacterium]